MSKPRPSTKPQQSQIEPSVTTAPLDLPKAVPLTTTVVPRPETFRLPSRGGDQHFGLTRSFYYNLEKHGLIKLIRLRKRGNLRGVTLVPYTPSQNSFGRQQNECETGIVRSRSVDAPSSRLLSCDDEALRAGVRSKLMEHITLPDEC